MSTFDMEPSMPPPPANVMEPSMPPPPTGSEPSMPPPPALTVPDYAAEKPSVIDPVGGFESDVGTSPMILVCGKRMSSGALKKFVVGV